MKNILELDQNATFRFFLIFEELLENNKINIAAI